MKYRQRGAINYSATALCCLLSPDCSSATKVEAVNAEVPGLQQEVMLQKHNINCSAWAEYWRARVKIGAAAVGRLSYYGAVSTVSGGAKIFLVQLTYF